MSQDCIDLSRATVLQQTLDSSRNALELVAHKRAAKSWLWPAAESEAGTKELYELLEDRVEQPQFEQQLTAQRRRTQQTVVGTVLAHPSCADGATSKAENDSCGVGASGPHRGEVLQRDWWELKPDGGMTTVVAEATGDYVVVEREDVVDALSVFIASYISTLPEAQQLEPRQLQRAITDTLKELRKGRVRRILDWGRVMYRVGAVGYGAFSVFSNPWLAQALLAALWTFVRAVGRMAF